MGLQVEDVKRETKKRQPVADYVDEDDAEWLQHRRVELNAMSSPQLLAWLDTKLAAYGEKLVPPDEVLASRLEHEVRSVLERQITEQVLSEARVGERVQAELDKRQLVIAAALEILPARTREELIANPADHWTGPVANMAQAIVDSDLAGSCALV